MILGIETSCDDSCISLVKISNKKTLFHKKISQEQDHNVYGGVVPELASRLHAKFIPDLLQEIRHELPKIKAVAVTNEPGLILSLAQGLMAAKALAIELNVPIIPVHHLLGHLYSVFLDKESFFPLFGLIVSGGHTSIIGAKSYTDITEYASSMDDSIGESFDKLAKMLDLGYPGGPVVEKLAKNGNETTINFTVPLKNTKQIAFSYSGLKNAARLTIEQNTHSKEDICASFQKVCVEHLLNKCEIFFAKMRPKHFAIVGGVSANIYLRSKMINLCQKYKITPLFTDLSFATDNAAMIARAGVDAFLTNNFNKKTALEIEANSRKPFKRAI